MYPAVFPLSCSACTSIWPLRSWRVLTKWVARTPNAKKREFSCLKKLKRLWEKTWLKSTRPSDLTQVLCCTTMYVFWFFWIKIFIIEVAMDSNRAWCPKPGCNTICHICGSMSSNLNKTAAARAVNCPKCEKEFCSKLHSIIVTHALRAALNI